jgi:hypothetical protein
MNRWPLVHERLPVNGSNERTVTSWLPVNTRLAATPLSSTLHADNFPVAIDLLPTGPRVPLRASIAGASRRLVTTRRGRTVSGQNSGRRMTNDRRPMGRALSTRGEVTARATAAAPSPSSLVWYTVTDRSPCMRAQIDRSSPLRILICQFARQHQQRRAEVKSAMTVM